MDISIKIECPNCGKELGENIKDRNRYGDLGVVLVPDICEKCYVEISSLVEAQKALAESEVDSGKYQYELEIALDKISKLELCIENMQDSIDTMTKTIADLEGGTSHEVEPPIVI